jgi:hypothetical protein
MTGYGVLVDRTDFEAHMRSGRYARFDAASAGPVVSKPVRFGALVREGFT